ncbi:hypothetical protein DFJ63DRAFT_334634 [Scheffersomyces coipomensis]|uniref:uncharacterized protein n=1 Tax=Scheffersomyces coipomensis TaxID=1788519 RepID=UPI00315DEFEB
MSELPSSIKSALVKPLERVYLLYLERELISFIQDALLDYPQHQEGNEEEQEDNKQQQQPKPQYTIKANYLKNSYYRLLSHQLCQYYNLQHWNNTLNEIIVTPTDAFNYKDFMSVIEKSDDKDVSFKKLSDLVPDETNSNGTEINHHNHSPSNPSFKSYNNNSTIIKPKLIMKKNKPSKPVSDDNSDTSQHQDTIDSKISSPIPDDSSVTSTPTEVSETFKIESERASKEALYLKVREQIFDEADDDAQEEEEEEDDDDGEEFNDEFVNNDNRYNSHQRYNQINPPKFIPYMNASHIPMHMPMAYGNGMSPPTFVPANGYFPPSPGAVPIVYPTNFYTPNNAMLPPGPGYYGYPVPPASMGGGPHGPHIPPNPPYDKETERRLLNNPYIIIPGDNNHKSQYKPRQNSTGQGKGNGYNVHHYNNNNNGNGKYYNGNANGNSTNNNNNNNIGYNGGQYTANSNYYNPEPNGTKTKYTNNKTVVPKQNQ